MGAKKKIADKPPVKASTSKKATQNSEAQSSDATSVEHSSLSPIDQLQKEGIIATFAANSKKIHRNVRDINVSNLTVTFNGTPFIEEAELSLNYGNRYGFIGRNGSGKSTFMRVIAARCFQIPDGIDIFHLKEEIEATDMTAKEAVMAVDVERAKLEAEAEELNDLLSKEEGTEDSEEAMERLTQVYERLEELDAATAETRASKILMGLGFTPITQNKKTKDFSGGWRMRIALARALFIQPTLLLLDEPTNHLDMEAVVWLEDYLSKWNKILFMVSHSQDFLNNVCTHIVHITKKKLNYYSGNYDSFVNTRAEKEEEQEKRYKAEQDQIKHMKQYVAKFGQGNAKMAKQAQSKEKLLDKMLKGGLTDKVEAEKVLDFKFPNPDKLSPPVLQCNDITFGYPGCEILYSHVDFGIDLDSRVALVGPNGAGKSTLLKIMTQELIPLTGAVRPHAHLRISKFSQHFVDVLDLSMTPLDYFLSLWADMTREEGRKFLGRFGISGSVQTQVMNQLSDGQKSRVVLAKMARESPHVLFLDEPTNHLDMESIDSLAKAINNFEGGMMLVSHDMRLISQVAKEIWLCDNKTVTKYMGEISDFKMQLRRQLQLNNLVDDVGSKKLVVSSVDTTGGLKVAPIVPSSKISINSVKVETEEDLIRKARLELAEIAIANSRAIKNGTLPSQGIVNTNISNPNQVVNTTDQNPKIVASKPKVTDKNPVVPESMVENSVEDDAKAQVNDEDESEIERLKEEKALAKSKRKAEKEAAAALLKKEEEERQRRREEKIKEAEEAKRLKEIEQKSHEEWLVMKAAKDAKKKAEEDAELAAVEALLAKRKAERDERRQARALARKQAQEAARLELERIVLADPWTQDQQNRFEDALLQWTSDMDKSERWTKIAQAVPGKTKNQCLARYKYLKEFVVKKKLLSIDPINPMIDI